MDRSDELALPPRSAIVEMVRRWGGLTTDAILDPSMTTFIAPGIQGFINYRIEAGCAVVFGDPICAGADLPSLTQAFHRFIKDQGKQVIYVAASQAFARLAAQDINGAFIEFGKELIFDPTSDPRKKTGEQASLVRRKVKQAIREGVVIQEYVTPDAALQQAIEQVGILWLESRRGLQMHISNVYLFEDAVGKRWFYAKLGERVVGVLCANQLQAHQGWLINHLMITPDAPKGTSELLMVSLLEALEKEGCRFATVGTVTLPDLGEIAGLSAFSTWVARKMFKLATRFVKLDGLNTFWGKFSPETNRPTYLVFSRKHIGLREVMGLMRTMSSKAE
jgi:lysylphosphatidylglycerol synthetase-like protein (DUF2156 family)